MNNQDKPGCLGSILQALGLAPKAAEPKTFPYRVRDDFMSPAERSFYHVLRAVVGDWALICPKVSLDDLFYAQSGSHKTNVGLRNRIARKHVDFLLCDPGSTQPLLGIELDDSSHDRASRQERDAFVEQVFAAAGLPLMRQPVQPAYDGRSLGAALRLLAGLDPPTRPEGEPRSTDPAQSNAPAPHETEMPEPPSEAPSQPARTEKVPRCPKCGQPMVLRTVQKEGPYQGRQFWGCASYPRCRGVRDVAGKDRV